MGKVLKKVSIALLCVAGLGSVYADPGPVQEWRDTVRVERQQRFVRQDGQRRERFIERQEVQGREQYQGAPDRRRRGDAQAPPELRRPNSVESGVFNVVPDETRKPGRLTPEERRALRRQINEAGRDIYAPRR